MLLFSTLAYYGMEFIKDVKCFIMQALGAIFNFFSNVKYKSAQ